MIKVISWLVVSASLLFAPFLAFSGKCESIFKNKSGANVTGTKLEKLEGAVLLSKKRGEPDTQHAEDRGPVDNAEDRGPVDNTEDRGLVDNTEDRGLEAYIENQVDQANDVIDNAGDRVGNVVSNIEERGIVNYVGDKAERLAKNIDDFISQDDREHDRKGRNNRQKTDIIDDAIDFFTRF